MQFHHHGYVSTDPRVSPASGTGIDRPSAPPENVDVLIVGSGPAGMLLAAQLSFFPTVTTRLIERREGRLPIGQADGIQARSVETFQAFGFAGRITAEAYQICAMNFWAPDPDDKTRIVRTSRAIDDPHGISEFPHLIVNQARVLDYFAEAAANAPGRITPDFGYEFLSLERGEGEYPVAATVQETRGGKTSKRVIHAKYVVGCDGARSQVRESIGLHLVGQAAMHAWAVMDVLVVTDFPDIRTKCAIQSHAGSILLIPREGGYLFRMYVDLGDTASEDHGEVRKTTVEQAIVKANEILHPYSIDVKNVAWYSVYEVGHRLTSRFDDNDSDPRVFIAGDACHTHSAKAGQGMNVSMQDGFNLGWKLGSVLTGRSPESLLRTYHGERLVIAQNLIDFDKEWSTLMAIKPEDWDREESLDEFYQRTAEFPAGFMTQYLPSMIIADAANQSLAEGYPIGKRFKSARVIRIADAVPAHLGHHARADGRWRIYAFADTDRTELDSWAEWMLHSPESPLLRFTPTGSDPDSVFDVKVIYQQDYSEIEIPTIPKVFLPQVGPFELIDYEKIYAARSDDDIFETRGIDRGGAVVVVRPDQYVAGVWPLTAPAELAAFFAGNMLPAK
ncbi:MAG: FAD-dependent monooxygenase [Cryobacterium sp.]|nr:FAD-dependent monooxygenase [Cryobacterium sp.]